MRKIILIVGLLLCVFLATLFAQPSLPQSGHEQEILKKLDQILQNQADQLEYLKFIKNRSH